MDYEKIQEIIIETPIWRTLFSFIIPILAGILSGSFVTEITINGALDWSICFKTYSFYGLLFLSTCTYFYNKSVYLFDKEISKFSDADYCTAYIRSKCLPEAAKKFQESIRNGNGGELKQAMDELKKVLK